MSIRPTAALSGDSTRGVLTVLLRMPVAVACHDRDGRVVFVNAAAQRLLPGVRSRLGRAHYSSTFRAISEALALAGGDQYCSHLPVLDRDGNAVCHGSVTSIATRRPLVYCTAFVVEGWYAPVDSDLEKRVSAHEIGNLCATASLLVASIRLSSIVPQVRLRALSRIIDGIRELSSFVPPTTVESVDLADVLADLRSMVHPAFRRIRGRITAKVGPGCHVDISRNNLLQICLNLALNAQQALASTKVRTFSIRAEGTVNGFESISRTLDRRSRTLLDFSRP